ncbi:PREDICTED: protein NRT1/ PTR FAMILY 5.10-like isoform X2 [Nelumbo nucifera]|uniref:Protein NRT1/ PTR FAMILY 5.10-like isoform X2 n=1 Tax=Nelumbo nucifera TaxID=4432 RepID=A0A1U7Z355_NELNU|nr:PREDICTED: protein NRT1/ PTR FAMILY 5.10-like isoform X2 [Nelumbo nucifera]
MEVCDASISESPLLGGGEDMVEGMVDYKGRRVIRSKSGGWRSASFIIGVEMAERFAYYGIASNLISYLTGPLRQSTATAAANVNAWSGAASMFPLLGAFVADAYLGRFRTILFSSLLYVLGLGLLTVSAILPSPSFPHNQNTKDHRSCLQFQIILFFVSLYLVAIAQGGHKPCVQAFGADQFDGRNPDECKSKSSFFNWWYFGFSGSSFISLLILNYIQDNFNWVLGFGIPCISMVAALVVFLLGRKTYRYSSKQDNSNPFLRIAQVFVAAARNWRTTPSTAAVVKEEEARILLPRHGTYQFKFLDKALAMVSSDQYGSDENWKMCSISQVEEAKVVLSLVPIWATCLIYAVVFAQSSTFFTKQGLTMERSITPGFEIPPATLQSFISIAIVVFIPIYDRIIVPIARAYTGKPSGITMLQRIGTGMFLSLISMVVAAIVEKERLKVARDSGLVDMPQVTLPMSVWWLVPQYVLFGVSDVFTMVGLQEFFYDQVPNGLRSMGLSLYLSIFGIGNFLSSFLISVIEKATSRGGQDSWFANNLNRAHLDWFYWLLAGLSVIELILYLYFAKSYIYNRVSAI